MNQGRTLLLLLLPTVLCACGEAVTEEVEEPDRKAIPVTSTLPQARDIDYILSALGSVESIQDPTISAETSGRITELRASEGSAVVAGQLLLEIDDTLHQIESAKASAELKRQEVVIDNQRREVQRLKRLEKSQSVSADQLEDQQDHLEMLQAQRDVAQKVREHAQHMQSKTRVAAPQAGIIARRHVSLGDYVAPGQPLFDLVSVERLRARLSFPEQDAAKISIGKEVHLRSPAAPDSVAIGEVTSINPRISLVNRAIEVMVEFDNPGGWYPGSSVDATLVVERHADALTVPAQSVVTRQGAEILFIVRESQAHAQPVSIGWRETDWVEILDGLNSNDRVVVQGASLLSQGSRLRETHSAP